MQSVSYPLLTQQLTINTTFIAKQFLIKNSSQFPIFINTSGGYPNPTSYEFSIQPNCDFNSSEISAQTLFVFTPATVFTNYANIDLYDAKRTEPNNTPYLSNQSVQNIAGYPATVNFSSVPSGLFNATLPQIKFETPTPIYFLVQGSNSIILVETTNVNVISGIHRPTYDGIMYFAPTVIQQNISFQLVSPTGGSVVVSVFNSPNIIFKPQYKNISNSINNALVTTTYYSYVAPPAFYMDLYIVNILSPVVLNYNLDITISLVDINGNVINILPTTNFSGALALNIGKFISDFLTINTEYRFLFVTIKNNLAFTSGQMQLSVNIFNY